MSFKPLVSWVARVENVTLASTNYHFICDIVPLDPNDPGWGDVAIGDILLSNDGYPFEVIDVTDYTLEVKDLSLRGDGTTSAYGPVADKRGYIYRPENEDELFSQAQLRKLDSSAADIIQPMNSVQLMRILGDRVFTEQNYVTDKETITASLDILDQTIASQYLDAGGSDTQLQYNNSGKLDGAAITYNNTTNVLSLTGELNMGDNPVTSVNYIDFNLSYSDGISEGRMQWNSEDGTPEVGMPGGNVNLQLGQELLIRVKEALGVTVLNGQAVYISGASGQRPEVSLADADDYDKSFVLGIATESITGTTGYITSEGLVREVNTGGMTEGDCLWLSQTPGAFTNVRPDAPAMSVFLGQVVYAHATEGIIIVRPTLVPRLSGLSDVYGTPSDNHVPTWNNTNSRFEFGLVGLTDGVTGVLPVANGGTNITSYTAGDMLYASGSTTLAKLAKGADGQVLKLASGIPTWANESSGGTPAGNDTEIQFNDGGNFGAESTFTFDKTTSKVTLSGSSTPLLLVKSTGMTQTYPSLQLDKTGGAIWNIENGRTSTELGLSVGGATRVVFTSSGYLGVAKSTVEAGYSLDVSGAALIDGDVNITTGSMYKINGVDLSFLNLGDTPSGYIANKWLKVNAEATALELVDAPTGTGSPGGASKSIQYNNNGSFEGFGLFEAGYQNILVTGNNTPFVQGTATDPKIMIGTARGNSTGHRFGAGAYSIVIGFTNVNTSQSWGKALGEKSFIIGGFNHNGIGSTSSGCGILGGDECGIGYSVGGATFAMTNTFMLNSSTQVPSFTTGRNRITYIGIDSTNAINISTCQADDDYLTITNNLQLLGKDRTIGESYIDFKGGGGDETYGTFKINTVEKARLTSSYFRLQDPLQIKDGVAAPRTEPGYAQIYIDSADGDLKIKFGDGTVKTIVTDSQL